jgi:hypothetical protein
VSVLARATGKPDVFSGPDCYGPRIALSLADAESLRSDMLDAAAEPTAN